MLILPSNGLRRGACSSKRMAEADSYFPQSPKVQVGFVRLGGFRF
jgi:hypothetical protein